MGHQHVMGVYNAPAFDVASGDGVWLTDTKGRRYLDCVAGVATTALGHCNPRLIAALQQQARKVWHVSNIFGIPDQRKLAERLTQACFADVAFFANSGTEAVETALKVARKYHAAAGHPERIDVIGFAGSFHGRTYAAVNASGREAYLAGFGPRLPGYVQLTLDDEAGIAEAVARPTTAAVIVEPVQGEGGARALSGEWLRRVRELTRAHGVLLIYDEVQCGMGRTGRLFAHQWFDGVEPDIMAIAKALGGGFPVGACLATSNAAHGMTPGTHGSTFGGNPLAMAVALAVLDEIANEATLADVLTATDHVAQRLTNLQEQFPDVIGELRGKGLLIGLQLKTNNQEFMVHAREEGLLIAGCGENCVRLLPSLLISASEITEVWLRLKAACQRARVSLADAA
ncbi:MAG: aspartate aminotransferase family protein [Sphingomonadales bacterium]|nr:MAG: aspartate aminotransferase family protein [Sphingomonadales bacterium]